MAKLERRKNSRLKVNDQDAGFTILETCVAMVIMFIAVLGSISLFVYAIRNNSGANDREMSMAVAQQQLELLRNAPFTDTRLTATGTGGVTSDLTRAGRPYRMVTTITDSNLVDGVARMKTITLQVEPVGSSLGSVTVRSIRASAKIGPNR